METCIFCRIIKGEIPSMKVFENENVLAFMDIQPINPGHVLVIPKKHAELITELDDKITAGLFIAARNLNLALRKSGIRCEDVNFHLSDGKSAGQEVPHVHVHVIPRFSGDNFGLRFPPDYRTPKDITKIGKNAGFIQKALQE
jgi:histidine triad (HIT) family protein